MRILITNDDGIDAPGLAALRDIAVTLSDDVWIVAPEANHSGAGHSLSLRDPIRMRKIHDRCFAVQGTPTDCVIMAVRRVMYDHRPDLILSGVNMGQNLAEDVHVLWYDCGCIRRHAGRNSLHRPQPGSWISGRSGAGMGNLAPAWAGTRRKASRTGLATAFADEHQFSRPVPGRS